VLSLSSNCTFCNSKQFNNTITRQIACKSPRTELLTRIRLELIGEAGDVGETGRDGLGMQREREMTTRKEVECHRPRCMKKAGLETILEFDKRTTKT
jgi:hypothetical protein